MQTSFSKPAAPPSRPRKISAIPPCASLATRVYLPNLRDSIAADSGCMESTIEGSAAKYFVGSYLHRADRMARPVIRRRGSGYRRGEDRRAHATITANDRGDRMVAGGAAATGDRTGGKRLRSDEPGGS